MSMSSSNFEIKDYGKSRTKQSFLESTDINKIVKQAQRAGGIAHANKYDAAVYGEFEGVDLQTAYARCNRAISIFNDAPSEIRRDFNNDPFKFAAFCSDPQNRDKLPQLLPAIAEPGSFFPNPVKRAAEPEPTSTPSADPAPTMEPPSTAAPVVE